MSSADVLQLGLDRRNMVVYLKMDVTKYWQKSTNSSWSLAERRGRKAIFADVYEF